MRPVAAALRRAWRAASIPRAFFAELPTPPDLARAAAAAGGAGLVGSLALAWTLVRLTDSTGWVPIFLAVPALALPYLFLVAFLGGLLLVRPTGLDLRAWELVGWAWTPCGFLGVALAPIATVAPGPTLVGAGLMLPVWHLWLLHAGVRAHASGGVQGGLLAYTAVVFVLPTLVATGALALLAAPG